MAQHNLGVIYFNSKKDIEKAIHYLKLAANQGYEIDQIFLGSFYYNGHYTVRDISKSIFYLQQAANKNNEDAQCFLGNIYLEGKYVKKDINEAKKYFLLASNNKVAQNNLGLLYLYYQIKPDVSKAIHYFSLSANNNYAIAQYNLGMIYMTGQFVPRDLRKAIYYFSLAAKQKDYYSQYFLGIFLYEGNYVKKDIKKAIDLLTISSKGGIVESSFALGYLYHEGKDVNFDIEKAIQYYKEASSFRYQYAKNNLGIIYKNGVGNIIEKNIGNAIIYFNEAINESNDLPAMFNLAHIYLYEFDDNESIDKSIKLLIKLVEQNFKPSKELLCLALIKKMKSNNIKTINSVMQLFEIKKELAIKLNNLIKNYKLYFNSIYEKRFKIFKLYDYIYDYNFQIISLLYFQKMKIKHTLSMNNESIRREITSDFYDGFGL